MKQLSIALLIALLTLRGEARAEWVAAVYTGVSHTFSSDLHVRQSDSGSNATFEGVSWAPHPFTQGAPYYGLRLSYFPSTSSPLGVTLDFTHYKMYAETSETVYLHGTWNGAPFNGLTNLGARIQAFRVSHGVNLTSINAQFRWGPAYSKGAWQAHTGAGVLVYLPHSEGTVDDVGVSGDYQYGGTGGQIFAGAEYGLARHLAIMVESKFDFGNLKLELDPRTRIDTQVRTLHLIGGLAFHF
jgi:hypothetical protein